MVLQASIDFGIRLPSGEPHVSHIPRAKKKLKINKLSYPYRSRSSYNEASHRKIYSLWKKHYSITNNTCIVLEMF